MAAPDAKLRIDGDNVDGIRFWKLTGEIVLDSTALLREWADRDINMGHRRIIVDMGGVTYANSAGVGALARIIHQVHEKNGMICFYNVIDHSVLRVLEIQPNFDIFQTLDECKGFFLGLAPLTLYLILERSSNLEKILNDALTRLQRTKKYNIKSFIDDNAAFSFLNEISHSHVVILVDGLHQNAGNFIRRIKGHPETSKRHPVLVTIPMNNLDALPELLANNADDFIMTPPNPEELVIRLNQLRGMKT
jgi:anti-anti-sigma factor